MIQSCRCAPVCLALALAAGSADAMTAAIMGTDPPPLTDSHTRHIDTPPVAFGEFVPSDGGIGFRSTVSFAPNSGGTTQFGWVAALTGQVTPGELVNVEEELIAPDESSWILPDGGSLSDDGRRAMVRRAIPVDENGWLTRLWRADPDDPAGEWILRIRIAGAAIHEIRFRIERAPGI